MNFSRGVDGHAAEAAGEQATAAAVDLRSQGRPLDHIDALLVPEGEIVLHLVTPTSPDAAREAGTHAGIEVERVGESMPVGLESLITGRPR